MKKTTVLLLLLQIFPSCNGQDAKTTEPVYVQKLEYGLKGPVKEVISYICSVKNGEIPANTANYTGKITMTFDSLGNVIAINKVWDFVSDKAEFSSIFMGKGKDVSFKETSRINDGNLKEISYKNVWSDDYNYTIISPENNDYSTIVTLDKNYRIIKSVFRKEDSIQSTEEWETIYKNNKIQEIKTKITQSTEGETREHYEIQVVQEYDKYGNPTVIHGYKDLSKQKVESVLYKEYKYY